MERNLFNYEEENENENENKEPISSIEEAIEVMNSSLDVFAKTLKLEIYEKWNSFVFEKKNEEKSAFEAEILKIMNELGNASQQEKKFVVVSDKYRRALESFRHSCDEELEYVSEEIFQKNLDVLNEAVDFMRTQKLSPTEKAVQTHAKKVLERNIILKKFRTAVSKYVKQEEVRIADIQKYFFKRRLFNTIYNEVSAKHTVKNFDAAMEEIMAFNSKSYVGQKFLSGMKKGLTKLTYQARDNAIEKGAMLDLERLNQIGDTIVDSKGKTLTETYQRVLKQAKKRDKDLAKTSSKTNQEKVG